MWLSLYKIYSSSEILLGVEVKTRLVGQSLDLFSDFSNFRLNQFPFLSTDFPHLS